MLYTTLCMVILLVDTSHHEFNQPNALSTATLAPVVATDLHAPVCISDPGRLSSEFAKGRWEYKTLRAASHTEIVSEMQPYGAEGWELVTVLVDGPHYVAFLKRRTSSR